MSRTAGVVALLFTDLVGSTEVLDRLGDDAAEELRRTHFSLLRRAVTETGGTEVKSLGDGRALGRRSPLSRPWGRPVTSTGPGGRCATPASGRRQPAAAVAPTSASAAGSSRWPASWPRLTNAEIAERLVLRAHRGEPPRPHLRPARHLLPIGAGRLGDRPRGPGGAPLNADQPAPEVIQRSVGRSTEAIRSDRFGGYLERWHREWRPEFVVRVAELRTVDVGSLDDQGLAGHMADVVKLTLDAFDVHMLLHGINAVMLGDLAFTCRDLLGWDDARALELLSGLSDATTTPPWPNWRPWPGSARRCAGSSRPETRTPPCAWWTPIRSSPPPSTALSAPDRRRS